MQFAYLRFKRLLYFRPKNVHFTKSIELFVGWLLFLRIAGTGIAAMGCTHVQLVTNARVQLVEGARVQLVEGARVQLVKDACAQLVEDARVQLVEGAHEHSWPKY